LNKKKSSSTIKKHHKKNLDLGTRWGRRGRSRKGFDMNPQENESDKVGEKAGSFGKRSGSRREGL